MKIVLVVEIEAPEHLVQEESAEVFERMHGILDDHPEAKAYIAIRESADAVLAIFEGAQKS